MSVLSVKVAVDSIVSVRRIYERQKRAAEELAYGTPQISRIAASGQLPTRLIFGNFSRPEKMPASSIP